jgi:hypothetical protein
MSMVLVDSGTFKKDGPAKGFPGLQEKKIVENPPNDEPTQKWVSLRITHRMPI